MTALLVPSIKPDKGRLEKVVRICSYIIFLLKGLSRYGFRQYLSKN